jgi:hypothetical protein
LAEVPFDLASAQNKWLFVVYMAFIVGAAVLTYLLWQSGNKVQDAIVADATARIGEARQKAAEAEDSAGKANKRAGELEQSNLTLRGQVANLEANAANANKDLAGLQKAAADAEAAQQRVEIDLAKQQEKAAIAEKALADLQETIKPRGLSHEQEAALTVALSGEPKGTVSIMCVIGDGEGKAFASQVDAVLKSAGWTTSGVSQGAFSPNDPIGLGITVHSAISAPPWAVRLQQAFFSIGVPMTGAEKPDQAEGTVEILVGHKPYP